MTPQQVKDIQALLNTYPEPNADTFIRRMERLRRMAYFYKKKAPQSKDGGALFHSFVSAIEWAIGMLNTHKALTVKLKEILGEPDEDRL